MRDDSSLVVANRDILYHQDISAQGAYFSPPSPVIDPFFFVVNESLLLAIDLPKHILHRYMARFGSSKPSPLNEASPITHSSVFFFSPIHRAVFDFAKRSRIVDEWD